MREPSTGAVLFAERLLSTERRRKRNDPPAWWSHVFNVSVVTSFVFFFLM